MTQEVCFKNAKCAILYMGYYVSCAVILSCIFGILMTYFYEQAKDFSLVILIGFLILIGIWFFVFLSILFSRRVVITPTEIKLMRGEKVKWSIEKNEISECIYHRMHWYYCFFPLATINAYALQFKIKEKGISKSYCVLSYRQIKVLQARFNYLIKIIE